MTIKETTLVSAPLSAVTILLMYYYAASRDSRRQGEYSTNMSYDKLCHLLDTQSKVMLTAGQLEHLIYNMKVAIIDGRDPMHAATYKLKNYNKLLKELKFHIPELFRTEKDGEVVLKEIKPNDKR